MEYDLVIRAGRVIDGTGGDPFTADVAVSDGRIVKVGRVDGGGKEEIDADGLLVTPGFVDIHTHYDGQSIWSEQLLPSSAHGVTTVVMGNCGVGFAPCREYDHEMLISVMEGVEDIPGIVMGAGLDWTWETFPEYLDALDSRPRDIDVAAQLPHSPVRVYVMGERGVNREPATADDLAQMTALTREAIEAGALGVSTSRLDIHRRGDGVHIPSFEAAEAELEALGAGLRQAGRGVFQAVLDQTRHSWEEELKVIERVSLASGRPASFTYTFLQDDPDIEHQWSAVLDRVESMNRQQGTSIRAQIACRPIGVVMGHELSLHPFCLSPTYKRLAALDFDKRIGELAKPEVRRQIIEEPPEDPSVPLLTFIRDYEWIFPLGDPPDYEPDPDSSVAARARQTGQTPEAVAYDLMLAQGGHNMLLLTGANFPNASLDLVASMMRHPNTLIALGDGGAHYGMLCDASYPTYMLGYWTRDRRGEKMPLPWAVKALSSDTARAVGLADRGVVAPGYKADLNVIDYDRIALHAPHVREDLPGGGRRLLQNASGYVATIVGGTVITRDGKATGEKPGRLVRGSQPSPVR